LKGFEGALMPWMDELFSKLDVLYELDSGVNPVDKNDAPPLRYRIVFADDDNSNNNDCDISSEQHMKKLSIVRPQMLARVTETTRLTSSEWTQVLVIICCMCVYFFCFFSCDQSFVSDYRM
jgi:hypothetical protein